MANEMIAKVRADIDLMEASGTDVFLGYTTDSGKSDKTGIMSPASARSFLDVSELVGAVFTRIWMGRAEQF